MCFCCWVVAFFLILDCLSEMVVVGLEELHFLTFYVREEEVGKA